VFAFGALLWELIQREVPFDGLEAADIRTKVEKGEQLKLKSNNPKLQNLINQCREVQSERRCTFDTIVETLS
jgi:hypothetical protein